MSVLLWRGVILRQALVIRYIPLLTQPEDVLHDLVLREVVLLTSALVRPTKMAERLAKSSLGKRRPADTG
jgi:hypothetical protein